MSTASTCSIAAALLAAALGCAPRTPSGGEESHEPSARTESSALNPLDLPADLEVVPERYPIGVRVGRETVAGRSSVAPGGAGDALPPDTLGTLGGQVFKVQIFSSKLFGEARKVKRVADEIFDQPVTMDYEIPYFKVRVGSFKDRYDAEKYSQRVRAAGYSDSWVVAATVAVRRAAPLYGGEGVPSGLDDSTAATDGSGAGRD